MNLFNESPIIVFILLMLMYYTYIKKKLNQTKLCFIILLFLIFFYRDPYFKASYKDNIISSPSYGTIKSIIKTKDNIHIIIFLGVLDVHIQYYPINGTVINHTYDPSGKFNLAFNLNKSKYNEKMITEIDTKYGQVYVTQIAGYLVRRISCPNKIGQKVNATNKLGMIKFGSRVDLKIPANDFNLSCKVGDKVFGGQTILGNYLL